MKRFGKIIPWDPPANLGINPAGWHLKCQWSLNHPFHSEKQFLSFPNPTLTEGTKFREPFLIKQQWKSSIALGRGCELLHCKGKAGKKSLYLLCVTLKLSPKLALGLTFITNFHILSVYNSQHIVHYSKMSFIKKLQVTRWIKFLLK